MFKQNDRHVAEFTAMSSAETRQIHGGAIVLEYILATGPSVSEPPRSADSGNRVDAADFAVWR